MADSNKTNSAAKHSARAEKQAARAAARAQKQADKAAQKAAILHAKAVAKEEKRQRMIQNRTILPEDKPALPETDNEHFFRFSSTLIGENLKMFWYIPLLSFIVYFMIGIFPLILHGEDDLQNLGNYVYNCLLNHNMGYCLLLVAVPLIASVQTLRFLHQPAYALVVHAQPFSRSRLFNSQVFTGWLMGALPLFAMGALYLLFRRELHADNFSSYGPIADTGVNIFTATNILHWLLASLAIFTFFYGLFALAGCLTGTGLMQVLVSGMFFIIVPLLIYLSLAYCGEFFIGYVDPPELLIDIMQHSNPLPYLMFQTNANLSLKMAGFYCAIGLVLLLLSRFAYQKVRRERIGDSILFRGVEELITWLVTFVGMSFLGFLAISQVEGRRPMLIGMAIGALITFFVVKVVFHRSAHIFNKANLASLLVFALLACLFSALTIYDVTGFSERVPQVNQVKAVQRSSLHFGGDLHVSYPLNQDDDDALTSDEARKEAVALHQHILEKKLYDFDANSLTYLGDEPHVLVNGRYIACFGTTDIIFDYTLKNGRAMSRKFSIYLDKEALEIYNRLLNSEEFLADTSLQRFTETHSVRNIEVRFFKDYEANQTNSTTLSLTGANEIRQFLDSYEMDHRSHVYTAIDFSHDSYTDDGAAISAEICFRPDTRSNQSAADAKTDGNPDGSYAYCTVDISGEHTLAFLRSICQKKNLKEISSYLAQYYPE